MHTSENSLTQNLTAEQLLKSFLSPDVDLVELERVQSDLIMSYFNPSEEGYPSPERAVQVLEQSQVMIKMIRQISDFGKGSGVRRW
ncbi:hypothetical protein LZG72_17930 [Dyadobacter sp. CY323]|nr:hypothetical protein [Dyadobacter sp. CY323]